MSESRKAPRRVYPRRNRSSVARFQGLQRPSSAARARKKRIPAPLLRSIFLLPRRLRKLKRWPTGRGATRTRYYAAKASGRKRPWSRHSPRLSLLERQPRNADTGRHERVSATLPTLNPRRSQRCAQRLGVSRSAPHGVSLADPSDVQLLALRTRGPGKSSSPGDTSGRVPTAQRWHECTERALKAKWLRALS